ncbi:MAG TPA: hypothetical protein VFW79_01565 [Cellulomonas sp.]|uniref:hypothetical protein n=1 Tax=Cellulomonas sp. TaxID=40001 RepID=UPI002E368FDB|nr:hypothetical protein [Cellulomonas sp.]HEX5331310.1 hypothetical protein [Cellulomonas sp.]
MNDAELLRVRRLLDGTNPVPERVVEGSDERAAGRQALARIIADVPDPGSARIPGDVRAAARGGAGRYRTQRRVGLGAMAACILVAIGIVVNPAAPAAVATMPPPLRYDLVADGDIATAVGAAGAPVLTGLATVAAGRAEPPRAGELQYVRSERWTFVSVQGGDESGAAVVPSAVLTWVSPDGTLRRSTQSGEPLLLNGTFTVPRDGQAADGSTSDGIEQYGPGSSRAPGVEALASIGPDALRATLLERAGCVAPDQPAAPCLLDGVARIHDDAVVAGQVDAALWSLLAADPTIITLGHVTDRAGRDDVAVTTAVDVKAPVRTILLIDPVTAALVGVEQVLLSEDAGYGVAAPAVVGFVAFLEEAWVVDPVGLSRGT